MQADEVPAARRTRARWLWWGLCIAFAFVLGACGGSDGDSPELGEPRETSRVEGFGEVAFRVLPVGTPPTDDATQFCALLADTEERWEQGMTDRTDLAEYDGMIFKFDRDLESGFHMLDTPMPLTIAWFDENGVFISSTDMEPCLNRDDCPSYRSPRPYRWAIEVPRGALGRLKIGPGTALDAGGRCRPT